MSTSLFVSPSAHLRISSRSVRGAELVKHERVEKSHVSGHLLHPPQLPLFFGVRELDHQAGRSSLKGEEVI